MLFLGYGKSQRGLADSADSCRPPTFQAGGEMGHLVMGRGRGGLGQELCLLSHKDSIKEEEPCDFGPASLDLGTISFT